MEKNNASKRYCKPSCSCEVGDNSNNPMQFTKIKVTNHTNNKGTISMGDVVTIEWSTKDKDSYSQTKYTTTVYEDVIEFLMEVGVIDKNETPETPCAEDILKQVFEALAKDFTPKNVNNEAFIPFFIQLYRHSKFAAICLVMKTYVGMLYPDFSFNPLLPYYVVGTDGIKKYMGNKINDPDLVSLFLTEKDAKVGFELYKLLNEKKFIESLVSIKQDE